MVGGPGPEFQHRPPEGGARDAGKEKRWEGGWQEGVRMLWKLSRKKRVQRRSADLFYELAMELGQLLSVRSHLIIH